MLWSIGRNAGRRLGAAILVITGCAQAENLLRDPGFETPRGDGFAQWQTPAYWQGSLSVVTSQPHGGRRCAQLASTTRGTATWGRVHNTTQIAIAPGCRYRLSVWAKGTGQLVLGCIEYGDKVGKTGYLFVPCGQPAALTTEWQPFEKIYVPQDPNAVRVAVYAEVHGTDSASTLDDALFETAPLPGFTLDVRQAHTMAPLGGTVTFPVKATGPASAAPSSVLLLCQPLGGPVERQPLDLDARGELRWPLTLAADAVPGVRSLTFVLPGAGLVQSFYVDAVDRATYDQFAAATAKVRLTPPARLCFVGDSLTALYRGYNYVDKVRGWLTQKYGDAVTVTNAGVGGDYTTRVLARLDKDVLALNPTHVFVFLGHNDSKLKSSSDYRDAVVPPEQFEKEYREIIGRVQTQTKARVVVISATSSVYEITQATADKARQAGRAHNLFGKPEALEQFNDVARKVATDLGAGYLDVYEATRTHPDKRTLFTEDGVHVNNAGNLLIALKILEYLGNPE